jgi:hypothetical protein
MPDRIRMPEALPVNGDAELLALDDALDELSRIDERQGKIVEMKFFGGLSAPGYISGAGPLARHSGPRLGHRPRLVASANEPDGIAMTGESWERVKEILHQAMQLAPEQRSEFLDEACCPIPRCAKKWSRFCWPTRCCVRLPAIAADGRQIGTRIGMDSTMRRLEAGQIFAQRFQLVRKLGEGGMGQVWLAEQTSRCAPSRLKLIKAGMYDESVVQRFQSERQSLAIMDHPAIAKVFDAGTTPQGQPYFVMEYVPGCPLPSIAIKRSSKSWTGSNSSSRLAKECSTPTRRPSSIAI